MKTETTEARKVRRVAERLAINNVRWKVVCQVLYEGDLAHDDAVLEAISARRVCDCGGEHKVVPEGVEEA